MIKTGAEVDQDEDHYYRGLIPHNFTEDRSEKYFNSFRYSRSYVPSSYNAVEEGIVSPVQSQGQCGSCTAFATMATIETCFKKITGVFGDYSEQELVDCGYGSPGAHGCNGAQCYAYAKWIVKNKRELMSEADYPYLNTRPNLRCPREKPYRLGARITDYFFTHDGDEETLKKLVYRYGAVLIALAADSRFSYYGGGVLSGCSKRGKYDVNHAVTVVGYGTEKGIPYWLIKNSWGNWWGDNGFIKVKRGSMACGIGWFINTVSCEPTNGPTDRPTTLNPCMDEFANCPQLAERNCMDWGKNCKKSCGLCEGMTPHDTNTCPDKYPTCKTYYSKYCFVESYAKICCKSCRGTSCHDEKRNCPELAKTNCKEYGQNCKKSCGLCEGMTPHDSNTCPDLWPSCKTYWKNHCDRKTVREKWCCITCKGAQKRKPS